MELLLFLFLSSIIALRLLPNIAVRVVYICIALAVATFLADLVGDAFVVGLVVLVVVRVPVIVACFFDLVHVTVVGTVTVFVFAQCSCSCDACLSLRVL